MVEESKRRRIFVKLKFTYDEGRAASKGECCGVLRDVCVCVLSCVKI